MFYSGKNHWIRYGWGPDLSNEYKKLDTLYVKLSKPTLSDTKSIDIAVALIEEITQHYPPPYYLMASGGLDSQCMIDAWQKSKIPFKVITYKYISNDKYFNYHDLETIFMLHDKIKFDLEVKTFDIINFLENDLLEFNKETDCGSPQILTHMKFSESIKKGTILYSGNYLHPSPTTFLTYQIFGLNRYAKKFEKFPDKKIIPFFFLHTPNLAFSFKIHQTKELTYKNNGYSFITPKSKYTGFEKIKKFYDNFTNRTTVNERLIANNKSSNRVFDILFRYRLDYDKVDHKINVIFE